MDFRREVAGVYRVFEIWYKSELIKIAFAEERLKPISAFKASGVLLENVLKQSTCAKVAIYPSYI